MTNSSQRSEGIEFCRKGLLAQSESVFLEALRLLREQKSTAEDIALALCDLATVYAPLAKYPDARCLLKEASELAKQSSDNRLQVTCLNAEALIDFIEEYYVQAESRLEAALNLECDPNYKNLLEANLIRVRAFLQPQDGTIKNAVSDCMRTVLEAENGHVFMQVEHWFIVNEGWEQPITSEKRQVILKFREIEALGIDEKSAQLQALSQKTYSSPPLAVQVKLEYARTLVALRAFVGAANEYAQCLSLLEQHFGDKNIHIYDILMTNAAFGSLIKGTMLAESYVQRAEQILTGVGNSNPQLIRHYLKVADMSRFKQDTQNSESMKELLIRKALSMSLGLFGEHHSLVNKARLELAKCLTMKGEFVAAREHIALTLAIARKYQLVEFELMSILLLLDLSHKEGRSEEIRDYGKNYEELVAYQASGKNWQSTKLLEIAQCYGRYGQTDAKERALTEAYRLIADTKEGCQMVVDELCVFYDSCGKSEKGADLILRHGFGLDSPLALQNYSNLITAQFNMGRLDEAEAGCKKILSADAEHLVETVKARANIVLFEIYLSREQISLAHLALSEYRSNSMPSQKAITAKALLKLANAYATTGDSTAAVIYEEAIELARSVQESKPSILKLCLSSFADYCLKPNSKNFTNSKI